MILRRLTGATAVVITLAVVLGFHTETWSRPPTISILFFAVASLGTVAVLALSARGRSFTDLPVSPGRIVAVVPTYNERPETLAATIQALLDGTVVPDVIHVVDDGSVTPASVVEHPHIRWHRQSNLGKRQAQVNGLVGERDATFVLTVDSDSVVHPRAIEESLRAFSVPRVQAVTATCVVRNRSESLLTRLVDLEVVTGNAVMRRARSVLGVVAPTSGPFAMYRSAVLFDNIDDYIASGTYGDDRRLTHYALLRGEVVACDEAIVEMEMPPTIPAMFRQRTRWFQGYFRYLGWELQHLPMRALVLRVWNLVLIATFPVIVGIALIASPIATGRIYWEAFAYWIAILYAHTLHYLIGRPGLSWGSRLGTWLFLTPLLVPLQWFLIRPAMYRALTRLDSLDWVTREPAAS